MSLLKIDATDVIMKIPYELAARLEADDFFSDIIVVVADEGNVEATVKAKQAVLSKKSGKGGVAVIVLQVLADDGQNNLQFGPMTLKPAFQVIEQREINKGANGTGKAARRVARRIRDVIKSAGFVGIITTIKCATPCIIPIGNHDYGANVIMYQVDFECLENSTDPLAQVQMPQVSAVPNSSNFQIICATVGSFIYYTIDDSYPSPNNPDAIAYGTPQPVPQEGLTLRACAYAPGMIASGVQRVNITIN